MKKTLSKYFAFSLFVLLSSFSLNSFAIDFYYPQGSGHIRCKNSTEPTYSTSTNYPGTGCTIGEKASGDRCGFIGTFPVSCGSNTYYKTISVGTCPANSFFMPSGKCTPSEGFSAVRTGTLPNSTHGSFTVVQAGQECSTSATVYNPNTGVCDPVTSQTQCPADKPYLRFRYPNEYYCFADSASGEVSDIGILATLLGSSAVVLSGAFASISACIASLVCGAGLAVVGAGAVLTGFELFNNDIPPSAPSKAGVMQVVYLPSNPAPENDKLKILPSPSSTIIPPSNSIPTSNPDVVSYVKDGVSHSIDTKNNTVTYSGSFGGETQHGVLTSHSNGDVTVSTGSSSDIGTSGGQPVKQIKTTKTTYNPSTTNTQTGTSTQYQTGTSEELTSAPPVIDSGSSTGVGSGSCGSFACESTAQASLQQLKQINDNQKVNSEQFGSVQSSFDSLTTTVDSQMAGLITQFNGSGYHDALQSAFGSILPVSPFEKIYASSNQSCVFNFTLFNHEYHLSMCEALPFLHPALSFILQFILAIFVLNLVFERPRG